MATWTASSVNAHMRSRRGMRAEAKKQTASASGTKPTASCGVFSSIQPPTKKLRMRAGRSQRATSARRRAPGPVKVANTQTARKHSAPHAPRVRRHRARCGPRRPRTIARTIPVSTVASTSTSAMTSGAPSSPANPLAAPRTRSMRSCIRADVAPELCSWANTVGTKVQALSRTPSADAPAKRTKARNGAATRDSPASPRATHSYTR